MIFLLLILAVICLVNIKPRSLENDYMSKKQTDCIKGIFAIVILCSHLRQYLLFGNAMDIMYDRILTYIGQLMVAVFFFYSGYGIFLSYRCKESYEKNFFKKRIVTTWFHFAVAVTCFLALNIILGREYPIGKIILSYTAWSSIGNSNWFIFDTILLYFIAYIAMKKISKVAVNLNKRKQTFVAVFVVGIASMVAITILSFIKETWWYDTLLCFFAGGLYSLYKEKIDKFIKKNNLNYVAIGLILIGAFGLLYIYDLVYNLCAVLFVLCITWFTMKVQVINPILLWLGKYSFYIYIYMRIPMIILTQLGMQNNIYVFTAISVVSAIALARVMASVQEKIDEKVLKRG